MHKEFWWGNFAESGPLEDRKGDKTLKKLGVWKYEGRLQSSWTHLITPSRNFVEVR